MDYWAKWYRKKLDYAVTGEKRTVKRMAGYMGK
jgi:hypothetical protein